MAALKALKRHRDAGAAKARIFSRLFHSRVLSFGDGSNGALGHTEAFNSDAYEPASVPGLPDDVARVSCGHYHSIAITKSGEVWCWGRNNEGQLGRGFKSILSPATVKAERVQGLEAMKMNDATGSGVVSIAISAEDGSLWVWGSSKRGQLGLGNGITSALLPQKIQALSGKRVSQVALGWGHALACTDQGELYSWGYHDQGRLGYVFLQPNLSSSQGSSSGNCQDDAGERMLREQWKKEDSPILQWQPRLVEFPDQVKIIGVACGLDHSLVLAEDGSVFSFGDNSTDQLGRETTVAVSEESVMGKVEGDLADKRTVQVSAGWGHSLAVARASNNASGEAFSWGWSSESQLGRTGSGSKPARVEGLEEVDVAWVGGGRVHSVCLTRDGLLWTWGCGKNGRLGLGGTRDEKLPTPVELEDEARVLDAACGLDHNLILTTAV